MDSSTKNIIYTEIMDILKNEDIKLQIRNLFKPIIFDIKAYIS